MASTTDVGSGSVSSRGAAAGESSTLASVPQIMYRSLQQTTIPPPTMQQQGCNSIDILGTAQNLSLIILGPMPSTEVVLKLGPKCVPETPTYLLNVC